ncbi:hypothetical protein Q1695_002905 [Nippostrongylus brasiliensis]|nr:hypothetical protein Q1695_002905 [Nippostrongylus brasiliensis]
MWPTVILQSTKLQKFWSAQQKHQSKRRSPQYRRLRRNTIAMLSRVDATSMRTVRTGASIFHRQEDNSLEELLPKIMTARDAENCFKPKYRPVQEQKEKVSQKGRQ